MLDTRESARRVILIRGRLLSIRHHLRAAAQHIVLISYRALWGRLLDQPIQDVVGKVDGACPRSRVAGFCQPPNGVIRECRGRIGIGHLRAAVQGIVLECGDLVFPIRELRQIAREVVLIALGSIQCVLPRRQPIHVVVGIRRRLVLGVDHRQEITVGIVREGGDPVDRILYLGDAIEVVVGKLRALASSVDDRDQARDGVIEPQGPIPERIHRRDQVPDFVILKGRRVIECIGHGEYTRWMWEYYSKSSLCEPSRASRSVSSSSLR